MDSRIFKVRTVDALARFDGPVMLYWEDHHFVVLESYDGTRAVLMDPAVGRRIVTRDELDRKFSHIVVTAVPTEYFQRFRARPFAEWRVAPLFGEGAGGRLIAVTLLSVTGYAAVLGVPLLTQWAIDEAGRFGDTSGLVWVILCIVGAGLAYFLLQRIRVVVLSTLVVILGRHLMTQAFSRLLALPYRFFTNRQPGELLFRMSSVSAVRDILSSRVAQGLLDLGTLMCVSVYLFFLEWRLALLTIGLMLLNAIHLVWSRREVIESVDSEISLTGRAQSMQLDAIVSIPTIKMGGYTDEFLGSWKKVYGDSLDAMRTRMRLQQGRVLGVTTVTQMFGPVLLLVVSLHLVNDGQISLGAAVAVQAVTATYFGLASSVFQTWTEFSEATRYMARLADIYTVAPEPSGGDRSRMPSASLEVRNLTFRYTKESAETLRNVSMNVPAGSTVAIVGSSGSGKTTLGRILCGLERPTSGSLDYGGVAFEDYDRESLRRQIGYVPQEVHLHNRNILENLTMGRDIPEETVRDVCRDVGVLDFVDGLPMGMRTVVAEMGANLSGGQRQRLAIVRILLQQPRILVLDEATSSLDTVNERRVSALLADSGTTRVVIAHRLSTVRDADHIYVMENGQIIEQGTHDGLIGNGGNYSRLYESGRELDSADV